MAIRILSSESISGFLTINTNDASGNRIGFKGDGATTGTAIHTNWTTGDSYLDFRLGGESDVYTKMRINNNGNVDIAGNLNLSVASSFITTSAGDLYLNPASNNTTLYDGTNAQIFNVYNAGNLAIKLDSASGTYGGVLLNLAGTNFVHGVSGQGLVLSHHNIGGSNAIVSGDASNPDNLYINNGGAANDWSNVIIEGNVGIGAAPNTKLEVRGGSGSGEIAHATFTGTANRGLKISTTDLPFGQNSGTVIFNAQDNEGYSQQWFQIGGATKMIINNSGRVGIAITPSAWGVDALQVGQASISQDINSVYVGANTYNSPAGWKRINAQLAGYMRMGTNDGIWSFSNGVTGTADSVIAWDERMRIDSAGNVGIGDTNPVNYKLAVNGTVKGDSFSVDGMSSRIFAPSGAVYNGNGSQTGYLIVKLPDFSAAGINNMMTGVIRVFDYAGNESFDVHFAGYWYSGYNWTNCSAWIDSQANVDRNFTVRWGSMPGNDGAGSRPFISIGDSTSTWSYVKFSVINYEPGHSNNQAYKWDSGWNMDVSTTLPGSSLRDTSTTQSNNWARSGQNIYYGSGIGAVGIGDTNPAALANRLSIAASGGTGNVVDISTGSTANNNVGAIVFRNSARNYCGQITVNGATGVTSYLSASDYRLKEDLQDFQGLNLVSNIKVYNYKWKSADERTYGVMAHELQEVLPQAVVGEKDHEEMQSVDYSKIVPLLVKSIQELKAEIELLKNK